MRYFCLMLMVTLIIRVESFSQAPGMKSIGYYNGTLDNRRSNDFIFDFKPTHDKGYILVGGDSTTQNPTKQTILNRTAGSAGLILKLDSAGRKQWGTGWLVPYAYSQSSVVETDDGGYVTAGFNSGNVYRFGFSVIKVNGQGNYSWSLSLGGSGVQIAYSISKASSGGYIVAGTTNSSDGDITDNHNSATGDAWVVRLDNAGTVQWKKCFGGAGWDTAFAVIETPDLGFVIAGSSTSADADLPGNKGKTDGWLLKMDETGNVQWKKNIGGTGDEGLRSLTLTQDGAVIAAGYTFSNDGDITGNHGKADTWLVKCSLDGTLAWSKCFGGTQDEYGLSIERTLNNEYLLGGFTESADGDVSGNNGGADGWINLVSASGNLIWQKCVGTTNNEYGVTVHALSTNNFVLSGTGFNPTADQFGGNYDGMLAILGNSNRIKGNAYLDANLNGVRDNNEKSFNQLVVNVNKSGVVSSAIPYNGSFGVDVPTGNFTTTTFPNSPYYTVVPASHASSFSTFFNVDSFDFAVRPLPQKQDITVNAIALTPARPGFAWYYKINYRNAGTVDVQNATVNFTLDSKTDFIRAVPDPSVINGNTLRWNYSAINSLDSGSITVILLGHASINDKVDFLTMIEPASGDLTPSDNTSRLNQIVTGSFDPNDISEANAGKITRQQLTNGEYLHYLIRFQNTGTDTAFTITVKDTLESKLDWNTLQMVSSSHAYQLSLNNSNQLSWLFNNVNLVDSNHNEPASHGYIAYRIKPKSTLADGDIINNRASIYFDYNLPVQTNTEQTLLAANVALPVSLLKWNAALNNDKVLLSWQTSFENNVAWFEVQYSTDGRNFAGIGKLTARNSPTGYSYNFSDPDFVKGNNFYRLATVDADGSIRYSNALIIYAGANREIVSSVYPNPASGAITINLRGELKGNAIVSVFDLSGKQLLSFSSGSLVTSSYSSLINIGPLSKGVYFIEFRLNEYLQRKKLVVQ